MKVGGKENVGKMDQRVHRDLLANLEKEDHPESLVAKG